MKNMRKSLSILLVLTLLLNIPVPILAAEGQGVRLTMETEQQAVPAGEPVTVIIRADQDFATCGSGMTVAYDPEVLEFDSENSSAALPFAIHGPLRAGGKTVLRISFAPTVEAAAVSASEPLAVVQFRSLRAAETGISMTAAYLYDDLLNEIPVVLPEDVTVSVETPEEYVPVTGLTLEPAELTVEEGEMAALRAVVAPADASETTVIWTSSDDTIAMVSGGVIKGITEGTATITGTTGDGGFTASCSVTVIPCDAGYTVEMPEDTVAAIDKVIYVPVVIDNTDGETGYNAFDMIFAYDSAVLELLTDKLPGMSVQVSGGTVHVLGYGEDREIGTSPFVLEFRMKKAENTEIRIVSARVDNAGNAVVKNAALASLTEDRMAITGAGYPVQLPLGFAGDPMAKPDVEYTFRIPNDYYEYAVRASVNGVEIDLTDNGDGTYTVPAEAVTGPITVTAEKSGKVFRVTLGTDMSGEPIAQHGTDYSATIRKQDGYRYAVTVTVDGREYTGYAISGSSYTVPGGDITGNIVFHVTKTPVVTPPAPEPSAPPEEPEEPDHDDPEPNAPVPDTPTPDTPAPNVPDPVITHTVAFSGSGAGAAQGNEISVTDDGTYVLTLKQESGYRYQVRYVVGDGEPVEVLPNPDGTYTIGHVGADLEIIIEKELEVQTSVQSYLTLDQQNVYLIVIEAELEEDKALTYEGQPMHYSEAYGAWSYLLISDKMPDAAEIEGAIGTVAQPKEAASYSGFDVDQSGQMDLDDAQLVYDLYNTGFSDFDEITMLDFLHADVNGDRKVDVRDAAAVIWKIYNKEDEQA